MDCNSYALRPCLLIEYGRHLLREPDNVSPTRPELHLSGVLTPEIHQLIDERQNPVGICLNHSQGLAQPFRKAFVEKNVAQRVENQGQRSAELMGKVSEYIHLLTVHALLRLLLKFSHALPVPAPQLCRKGKTGRRHQGKSRKRIK